ncbi:GntR family transcriptional regulator [Nocardioides sp. LHG3406-4]|uniref:GntR family transcriptional regulator n=1 Tax=Nocardioides sp. LHG3406-4 TaxID=2804575 RepID=UPI003CEFD4C6
MRQPPEGVSPQVRVGSSAFSITAGRVRRDTYSHAKAQLELLIGTLAAENQLRLPSEDELSESLEVSRATVRSALLSLQKEGTIQRIHGRGTFINRHAFKIQANISQDRPFAALLEEMGHNVAVDNVDLHIEPLEDALLTPFELTETEDAVHVERIFGASGKPAVLSIDVVPVRFLLDGIDGLEGYESVFEFVRRTTGRQVRYSVADIVPFIATTKIAEDLGITAGVPLILLRHTHIDQDDRPVAFTRAYINDELLRFSVVRTYTDS